MGKVDELIEKLAEDIICKIEGKSPYEKEIAEQTKALAELVSARALWSRERHIKITNTDRDNLIKKNAQKRNMGSYS